MLYVASDAPTLCPELSLWVGPPPCPCPWATSLLTSVPALRADPSLCPGKFGSSHLGAEGREGCAVLLVRLCHPVCLCNYFCKNCLICGCHSLAPGLRPHLSSRPACTSFNCSGVSEPPGSLAARPSELRPVTQQPAQGTSSWGLGVVCCSAGGLSSEPRERDPT